MEPLAERRIPRGEDFLSREVLARITPQELIARMTALKPLVAQHADEAEQLRRPVDAVWQAIRDTGYFYSMVPRRFGGLEFDFETFISTTLPIAEADASTGWVASFCVEHNWLLSQMPEETQAEIWEKFPYIIAANPAFPPGQAERVDGGFQLTGRWKWATGIMHSDWVLLNGLVKNPDGPPSMHMFALRADSIAVIDTWHMSGMAATGSNDVVADHVFVPAHHQFEIAPVRSGKGHGSRVHANPLYATPMLPLLTMSAAIPAVGTARGAIALLRERLLTHVKVGSDGSSTEKPAAQMRLARASLLVASAELSLRQAAREIVDLSRIPEPEQTGERIRVRAQIAYCVSQCVEAVRTSCEAAGSSIHALSNPLQRKLRDLHVMQSHIVYDMDVATELYGRALVGLPPNSVLV